MLLLSRFHKENNTEDKTDMSAYEDIFFWTEIILRINEVNIRQGWQKNKSILNE